MKDVNPDSGRKNILHYRAEHRDQIANCMLLTAEENGFSNKSATPPDEWFSPDRFDCKEAHQRYLDLHLIPNDPGLWTLDRFDDFVEARKLLIQEKFKFMLREVVA